MANPIPSLSEIIAKLPGNFMATVGDAAKERIERLFADGDIALPFKLTKLASELISKVEPEHAEFVVGFVFRVAESAASASSVPAARMTAPVLRGFRDVAMRATNGFVKYAQAAKKQKRNITSAEALEAITEAIGIGSVDVLDTYMTTPDQDRTMALFFALAELRDAGFIDRPLGYGWWDARAKIENGALELSRVARGIHPSKETEYTRVLKVIDEYKDLLAEEREARAERRRISNTSSPAGVAALAAQTAGTDVLSTTKRNRFKRLHEELEDEMDKMRGIVTNARLYGPKFSGPANWWIRIAGFVSDNFLNFGRGEWLRDKTDAYANRLFSRKTFVIVGLLVSMVALLVLAPFVLHVGAIFIYGVGIISSILYMTNNAPGPVFALTVLIVGFVLTFLTRHLIGVVNIFVEEGRNLVDNKYFPGTPVSTVRSMFPAFIRDWLPSSGGGAQAMAVRDFEDYRWKNPPRRNPWWLSAGPTYVNWSSGAFMVPWFLLVPTVALIRAQEYSFESILVWMALATLAILIGTGNTLLEWWIAVKRWISFEKLIDRNVGPFDKYFGMSIRWAVPALIATPIGLVILAGGLYIAKSIFDASPNVRDEVREVSLRHTISCPTVAEFDDNPEAAAARVVEQVENTSHAPETAVEYCLDLRFGPG